MDCLLHIFASPKTEWAWKSIKTLDCRRKSVFRNLKALCNSSGPGWCSIALSYKNIFNLWKENISKICLEIILIPLSVFTRMSNCPDCRKIIICFQTQKLRRRKAIFLEGLHLLLDYKCLSCQFMMGLLKLFQWMIA